MRSLKGYVRQATAAKLLGGVTRQAVNELIKNGRLKTVLIDDVPHVTLSSLERFKRAKPGPKPKAAKTTRKRVST